ncbi:hypothetical protein [Streptomyces cremeus]|uniref:RNase NYN domain-containing protein n=1 Tax=Streptomyces cremeus TaxID=66881 RepID=A0ABV5P5E7_STRCM
MTMSFGTGGPAPEVRQELDDLMNANSAPTPTLLANKPKPAPQPSVIASTSTPDTIVVDGSNLAWIGRAPVRSGVYESDDRPSYSQLIGARDALAKKFPEADIQVVVDATFRHRVADDEREAVTAALNTGEIVQPPPGTEGKGDALVTAIADEYNSMVVTNDNFAELQDRYPWLRESGRVLGATLAKGTWIFTARTCVAPRGRR